MRCERCKGARFIIEQIAPGQLQKNAIALPADGIGSIYFDPAANAHMLERPCPGCHGSGVEDCCSGAVCDVPAEPHA